jgi:adenine-specific DNA-methyltransferase
MDEVFGDTNFVSLITVAKTTGQTADLLSGVSDYILWAAKSKAKVKYRQPLFEKGIEQDKSGVYRWMMDEAGGRIRMSENDLAGVQGTAAEKAVFRIDNMTSQKPPGSFPVRYRGGSYLPGKRFWATGETGMERLAKAQRLEISGSSLAYRRFIGDFAASIIGNLWTDTGTGSFTDDKVYIVQTGTKIVQRCLLMATDPGDLVLDPTCGSGTTAYAAEQWGRRWITIDTSRVALALARARIMGARYPFYHLRDTPEGVREEARLRRIPPAVDRLAAVSHKGYKPDLRQGFVYDRVPHITLKSIANNTEIDLIWDDYQTRLEPLRETLNIALGQSWEEWQIPRGAGKDWPDAAREAHSAWWGQRIKRQKEIDASIAAKADYEYLYDKPIPDTSKVRVAGPFTVESLSPHRVLAVDHDDELIDTAADRREPQEAQDFTTMVLENLRTSGVHQMDKGDRITFSTVSPWPGTYVCAEGRYQEGEDGPLRRAGIFIGPEFGTVQRADLVACARECVEAGFDIMVACAFSYAAQCTDLSKMGPLPILRARMNPDLHMADDLKNTGTGNLFVVFGEPDIDLIEDGGDLRIRINGVNVFKPSTGQVQFDGPEGIACWFIDTDYNEESFFVRHAYFLGSGDPYKALKTTLRAEVDEEAWNTLNSDTSRPFPRPKTGRIAVKAINHLGDEVMKVYAV